MDSLKELYYKSICDKISVCFEDLTPLELSILEHSYNIIKDNLNEIKELNDIIYHQTIEIKNLKSFNDDKDY